MILGLKEPYNIHSRGILGEYPLYVQDLETYSHSCYRSYCGVIPYYHKYIMDVACCWVYTYISIANEYYFFEGRGDLKIHAG